MEFSPQMDVMINAYGLQNGIHRIPYWLQGRGEGGIGAGAVSYCNGGAATAVTLQAPKGDPEIAEEWTTAQHAILEELLKKYESDPPVIRYAKLGLRLPGKKITDVAFRCKWMTDVSLDMKGVLRQEESKHVKKETRKRRNDDSLSRKRKNKKVKATDSSAKTSCHLPVQPNGTPNSMQMLHMDTDNDISYKAIGDPTGLLLEHTAELLNQISGNLTNFQLNDNIGLLFQARDSILEAMKELHDIPPEMQRMPPFRFMLKEELANSILPCIIPQKALHL